MLVNLICNPFLTRPRCKYWVVLKESRNHPLVLVQGLDPLQTFLPGPAFECGLHGGFCTHEATTCTPGTYTAQLQLHLSSHADKRTADLQYLFAILPDAELRQSAQVCKGGPWAGRRVAHSSKEVSFITQVGQYLSVHFKTQAGSNKCS